MWFKLAGGLLAAFGAFLVLAHSAMIPLGLTSAQQEGMAMKRLGLGVALLTIGIYLFTI